MKTIKNLLRNEEKIYVSFSDTKTCMQFLVNAENEGFISNFALKLLLCKKISFYKFI
jgi:ribosomal protein S8